jgi:transcriptional regulator with XRE-family HTH domain
MTMPKKSNAAKKPGGATKGFQRGENLWAKSLDYWLTRSAMSEQDLADKIGVSQGQISHWRRGRFRPPALSNEPILLRMAEVLGMDKVAASRFLDDARLSALPVWATDIIAGLKKENADLRAKAGK